MLRNSGHTHTELLKRGTDITERIKEPFLGPLVDKIVFRFIGGVRT